MPATDTRPSLDDLARLGIAAYDRRVRPRLTAADDDKFAAVDVDSGEYELDDDDYTAVARLKARVPAAEIWLMRVGHKTAYRFGAAS